MTKQEKFGLWWFGCILVGILIIVILDLYVSGPKFKLGEEVIIKDYIIYSVPVALSKGGLKVKTGYSIGEKTGKVVLIRSVNKEMLKPIYGFFVEFSYEEFGENKTRTEWFSMHELKKKGVQEKD